MTQLMVKDTASMIANAEFMNNLHMFAQTMAQATVTVPKHLSGNVGDCMAICMQAAQWGMNPYLVAQKTHIVQGNLGYEAQLVNAVVSSSNAITGRFKYEYAGDWDNGRHGMVRAGAVISGEQDITWGEWVDCAQVKVKNSPLWKQAPKQQAAYLACKMWARLYTPDVILGVYTPDELQEVNKNTSPEKDVTPAKSSFASRLSTPEPVAEPAIEDKSSTDFDSLTQSLVEAAKNCKTPEDRQEIIELVQKNRLPQELAAKVGIALRGSK